MVSNCDKIIIFPLTYAGRCDIIEIVEQKSRSERDLIGAKQ